MERDATFSASPNVLLILVIQLTSTPNLFVCLFVIVICLFSIRRTRSFVVPRFGAVALCVGNTDRLSSTHDAEPNEDFGPPTGGGPSRSYVDWCRPWDSTRCSWFPPTPSSHHRTTPTQIRGTNTIIQNEPATTGRHGWWKKQKENRNQNRIGSERRTTLDQTGNELLVTQSWGKAYLTLSITIIIMLAMTIIFILFGNDF